MKNLTKIVFVISLIIVGFSMFAQQEQKQLFPKTHNMLYVDDTAKVLLPDDLAEIKKIALSLRRTTSQRLHFLTGKLKKGTEPDDISSRLAKVSGIGIDDGDDDCEAIFTILFDVKEEGFTAYSYLISGAGLKEAIEQPDVRPLVEKKLLAAINSPKLSAEERSKAILDAYARTAQSVASAKNAEVEGLDTLIDNLAPQLKSAFALMQQNGQDAPKADEMTQSSVPASRLLKGTRDPGVPPAYDGVQPPKPASKMYVCDWGDMLTPQDRAAIEALGTKLDSLTTAELVVVTVPDIADRDVTVTAFAVARNWGIGKKDKDNGCLLFVVKDRMLKKQRGKISIQVGYGLEGCLNDAKCGRILDDIALPPFLSNSCTKDEGSTALLASYEYLAREIAAEYNVSASTLGLERSFYTQLPVIEDYSRAIHDFAKILTAEDAEFIESLAAQLTEKAKGKLILVTIEDDMGVPLSNLVSESLSRNYYLKDGNSAVILFAKNNLDKGKGYFAARFASSYPQDIFSSTRHGNLKNKVIEPTLNAEGDKAVAESKALKDAYICIARLVAKHDKAVLELPKDAPDLSDYESWWPAVLLLLVVLVVACFFCPPLLVVIILPFILIYQLFLLPFPKGREKIKKFWKDVNSSSGSSHSSWGGSSRSYSHSYSSSRSSSRSSYGGGGFGGGGASR